MSITQEMKFRKWERYKKLSAIVSKRLRSLNDSKLVNRGENMADCARFIEWAVCPDCGTLKIANAYLCRDRLCPTCAWRLSLRRYSEMIQVFEATGIGLDERNVAMLTVTIKNVGIDDLGDTIDKMLAAWSKLMKRRPVHKNLLGWARSLEITNIGNGYHPHIHALLVMPPNHFITQEDWCQMWKESLEIDYTPIVDIRMAYNNKEKKSNDLNSNFDISVQVSAAVEALKGPLNVNINFNTPINSGVKSPHGLEPVTTTAAARAMEYSFKPNMLSNIPQNELRQFAYAIRKRRLVTFGGVIAETRKALKMEDDDTPESSEIATSGNIDIPLCPKCGAECSKIAYEWANDCYIESNNRCIH